MAKLESVYKINHHNPFGKLVNQIYTLDSMVPFLSSYPQDVNQGKRKKKDFIPKGSITLSTTIEKSWNKIK